MEHTTERPESRTDGAIRLAAAAEVARGLTPLRSEPFFRELVSGLAACLDADLVFTCETFERDGRQFARVVAQHPHDILPDGFEYALAATPCEQVLRAPAAIGWRRDVVSSFPDDHLLQEGAIESYVGVSLRARDGTPIGLLMALYRTGQDDLRDYTAMLDIFAMPAASELERRRLLSAAERAAALVERSVNEIYVVDAQTFQFIDVNQSARENLGYSLAELRGMTPDGVSCEDAPASADRLRPLLRGETETLRFETIHRRRDRSTYPIELSVHRFDFGGRRMFAGIGLDITERRKLEAQLLHSQKLEAVGSLAGGVAHDFNNLLTALLGNVALMYADLEERAEDPRSRSLARRLAEIERASDRASSLTRQLLTFSRKDVTKLEALKLNQVVAGMESMLRRLIGGHIELELDLDPASPWVRADAGQMEQVVMNLALNARDAMEDGGRLSIRVSPDGPAGARLTVGDTGTGMDAEVRERMFEPFFTTKEVGKGTGLGLSTTYGIVKSIGGEVGVESEPGSGTTFSIWLPATEEAPTRPQSDGGTEAARGDEVVLVCEDDDSVRDVTCEILRASGYRVFEAASAESAEGIVAGLAPPIDLLITDVVMPEVNGHELARRLFANQPDLRVLLISGYSMPADFRGMDDGRLEFLQKPFARSALLRRVRRILD